MNINFFDHFQNVENIQRIRNCDDKMVLLSSMRSSLIIFMQITQYIVTAVTLFLFVICRQCMDTNVHYRTPVLAARRMRGSIRTRQLLSRSRRGLNLKENPVQRIRLVTRPPTWWWTPANPTMLRMRR